MPAQMHIQGGTSRADTGMSRTLRYRSYGNPPHRGEASQSWPGRPEVLFSPQEHETRVWRRSGAALMYVLLACLQHDPRASAAKEASSEISRIDLYRPVGVHDLFRP